MSSESLFLLSALRLFQPGEMRSGSVGSPPRKTLDCSSDDRLTCTGSFGKSGTESSRSTTHSISNVASCSYDPCQRIGGKMTGPETLVICLFLSFRVITPGLSHLFPNRCFSVSSTLICLEVYDLMCTSVIVAMTASHFETFRWTIQFTYEPISVLHFVDNIELSDSWPYIRLQMGNRTVARRYMNRCPQIYGKVSPLIMFSKTRMYRLNFEESIGCVISSTREFDTIPGLVIKTVKYEPYTTVFNKKFDFHIMLTAVAAINEAVVYEKKYVAKNKAIVVYQSLKFEIYGNNFAYTGQDSHDIFKSFCEKAYGCYSVAYPKLSFVFDKLLKPEQDPNKTHYALAFRTWHRGARENQREWPAISNEKINSFSIEFPINSGIWYTPPPGMFVGLSLRHDDNPEKYIPKLYKVNHMLQDSHLNAYYSSAVLSQNATIPFGIRNAVRHLGGKITFNRPSENPSLILRSNGQVYMTEVNPNQIVFTGFVISKSVRMPSLPSAEAQLLDKDGKVSYYQSSLDHKWYSINGYDNYRIHGIPTLPWYYKQIIHDYNRLDRLQDGPVMDLMHIGIVDESADDIITFPVGEMTDLYVTDAMQTHRLITFKMQENVYDLYSVTSKAGE